MEYKVLAYYLLTPMENPVKEVALHKSFLEKRNFKGRIYISEEGINGQASGSLEDAEAYMAWMKERFGLDAFKIHLASEHAFEKMTVKYRRQLVAIDCEVDFSLTGEHVSPKEWKKMLEERDEHTLLLDVRNHYEWKIGRFEGAELPELETFREFPEYARKIRESKDPQKTRVMMYCTGGIRCEFFSSLMKKEGFEHVYQLDGGIINYGLQEGSEHWKGKLFVFDDRLGVSMGSETISHCLHCAASEDTYYNCANMDCNALFVCCKECLPHHQGCCSQECVQAPRVRPFRDDGKPFRKFSHEEKQVLKSAALQS